MPTSTSRPHAQSLQMMGDLIGASIQLTVGQLLIFKDDGWHLGDRST